MQDLPWHTAAFTTVHVLHDSGRHRCELELVFGKQDINSSDIREGWIPERLTQFSAL